MMKDSSSVKELEEQVILASHGARQVEEVMTVVKHKAAPLEGQQVEQIQPMHQDFNKKHLDLLAGFDSVTALMGRMNVPSQQQQPEMWIDVVETSDDSGQLKSGTSRLNVDSSDTINAVKMKIYLRTKLPPDQQRLVYAGEDLDGDGTMADYDIQSGSKIHLMMITRTC